MEIFLKSMFIFFEKMILKNFDKIEISSFQKYSYIVLFQIQ